MTSNKVPHQTTTSRQNETPQQTELPHQTAMPQQPDTRKLAFRWWFDGSGLYFFVPGVNPMYPTANFDEFPCITVDLDENCNIIYLWIGDYQDTFPNRDGVECAIERFVDSSSMTWRVILHEYEKYSTRASYPSSKYGGAVTLAILEGDDGAFAGYEVCSRIGAMPFEPDVEWTCAQRIGEFPQKKGADRRL